MSKVGPSEDRSHDALTSRSTCPNRFRRDIGRAVARANDGNNVPEKVLQTLSVATDNSKIN